MQAAADNKNQPAAISWRALNTSNQSTGAPEVNYNGFAARWDQEGEEGILHQIVDRFDGNGLVLKTQNQEDQTPQLGHQKKYGDDVERMAKAATKRAFS